MAANSERVAELLAELKELGVPIITPGSLAGSVEFDGLARCLTPGCENNGDRPLRLRRETVEQRAIDLPITVTTTDHIIPVNDADLVCEGCGAPSAVLEKQPPTYARLAPS